ncbi:hypothetical protein BKP37_06365 [Anaerobacillus alkalilacustris]|uniref:Spore coat protein n=1 Tax=Anaerobacillus alkalilacustris TaxID=393763 RepID=A0A1S2LVI6_9BACI|nr:hypothetical protein [Anaerobacillus alkalilacustris]OIJ16344.1 hypothetical protein BKP37_06365 [Anaerobacillus alkalilacustris]
MNIYTYSYFNLYQYHSGNWTNDSNTQNTYVLDKQMGDVNGDNIPDIVYLIGEKKEKPFYENIKVIVQDGRTMQWYAINLYPNYSMAYTPWLVLANFTNSNTREIIVNLPVGGSGGLTYYYVLSFINNNTDYILGPEQFMNLSKTMGFEVIYMDNYRVLVKSEKLDQSYTLDISTRKEVYEGTGYNKDGKLIQPREGFVIDFPHLYPIKIDGTVPYKLVAFHSIAGTSHADRLGSIVLYWKYTRDNKS